MGHLPVFLIEFTISSLAFDPAPYICIYSDPDVKVVKTSVLQGPWNPETSPACVGPI